MKSSKCKVQSSKLMSEQPGFTTMNFELRTHNSGFTYVALLAAIVIIGISMGAAGKYWSFVMQREKEEELLFRGEQYRTAIERYYRATPGWCKTQRLSICPPVVHYPQSIDDLIKDSRFLETRRHLRQKYLDPMTGQDFEVLRDQTKANRIVGVFSTSEKEPFKKTGFPDQYQDFENKKAYKEWLFIYTMSTAPGVGLPPGQVIKPPSGASSWK